MSAKRQRNQTAKETKKPYEMSPEEQKQYAASVGSEVDKLLARRGCHLDVQPGLAPSQNGTWTIGVVARIVVTQPNKAN